MKIQKSNRTGLVSLSTGVLLLSLTMYGQTPPGGAPLAPTAVKIPAAVLRTIEQMETDSLIMVAPERPAVEINRPTMEPAAYKAAKEQAALAAKAPTQKPAMPASPVDPGLVYQFEGVNQTTASGWYPPDASGTVGHAHVVQVVNNHIDMYSRPSTLVKSVSLNTFVGYFTQALFDPNIVYDSRWRRWVFTCPAFQESAAVQYFFVCVSVDQNPTHGWYIYKLNVRNWVGSDNFYDYPHVGFDNDAIQWTANIFPNAGGFLGADLCTFAKSVVYNGLGGTFWHWGGLNATLMPTVVRDQNVNTWLAAAGSPNVSLYALRDSGRLPPALYGPYYVPVVAWTTPPNAAQPLTTATLDSLDGRFQNHTTQRDNYLWACHCVALGSWPAIRWYRIDTSAYTVNQSGTFYASGTSYDWNPHMTANGTYAWISWNSSNPSAGINAQIRYSGKLNAETYIDGGYAMFTSPTYYGTSGVQRWGDYSQVSLDPLNGASAFIINEKINSTSIWGTRIGQISY